MIAQLRVLLAKPGLRRAELRRRKEADARYRELLDRFIEAGETYLDAWVDGYDRAREKQEAAKKDA